MTNDLISIVMSVYNDEKTLSEAIKSILEQSYTNFEFIIINDGSIDNSLKIIQKFKNLDKRIFVINRENKGLAYSLNEAINKSNGKYIARMDADDISLPNRLEEQLRKFKSNKNLMVVGTSAYYLNSKISSRKIINMPESHDQIINSIFKSSPFIHPSIMMKKKFIKLMNGYNNNYVRCQDYDLWLRGRFIGEFYNIQIPLIIYSNQNKFLFKSLSISTLIRLKNSNSIKEYLISIFWSLYQSLYVIFLFIFKVPKKT